jgi:hypothetical protein
MAPKRPKAYADYLAAWKDADRDLVKPAPNEKRTGGAAGPSSKP